MFVCQIADYCNNSYFKPKSMTFNLTQTVIISYANWKWYTTSYLAFGQKTT